MYGDLPEHVTQNEFVCEHAVHLTTTFQHTIVAHLTAMFAVDGIMKRAEVAANGYVKCLPGNGPFMICAIIVAL